MFTANTNFEFRFNGASFLCSHANELSYAFLVEHFERICLDDAMFLIEFKEFRSVVARESVCLLRKVVSSEREEVGNCGDFICTEGRAGNLNHCSHFIRYALTFFFEHFGGCDVDHIGLILNFFE